MARQINPENIKEWYDPWKLKAKLMWMGYESYAAACARALHVTERTACVKINNSILSHEDTILLAQFLGLTQDEYCEIFLKGVFESSN